MSANNVVEIEELEPSLSPGSDNGSDSGSDNGSYEGSQSEGSFEGSPTAQFTQGILEVLATTLETADGESVSESLSGIHRALSMLSENAGAIGGINQSLATISESLVTQTKLFHNILKNLKALVEKAAA